MLYWLLYQKLYPFFHPFRIFRYLTFRTAFASGTALLITLLICPYVIQKLRDFQIGLIAAGREAVVFFFVLSGFVLSVPYAGPRAPRYGKFLAKRMCRIYPPFAAAVLISMLGDALLCSLVKINP